MFNGKKLFESFKFGLHLKIYKDSMTRDDEDMTRDGKVGLGILEFLYIFKRKPNLNSFFPLNIVR